MLAGAVANALISVPGIDTQDTVVSAIEFTAGVPSYITSTISLVGDQAAGTVTLNAVVAPDAVAVNRRPTRRSRTCPARRQPRGGVQKFVDGVAIMALGSSYAEMGGVQALGYSAAQAAVLIAGGAQYNAAAQLTVARA